MILRRFAVFASLFALEIAANDVDYLGPPAPVDLNLEATLSVQTFFRTTCRESDITQIGAFLLGLLNSFSTSWGSLRINSSPGGTPCNTTRRHLRDATTISKQKPAHRSRHLASLPGFVFKMPTACRSCSADARDFIRNDFVSITIRVKTDDFPREFSYRVLSPGGATLLSSVEFTSPNTEYITTLAVESGMRYSIVLNDRGGNGLCCRNGDGFIQVAVGSVYKNNTLFVERAFGSSRTRSFVAPQPTYSSSAYYILENQYSYHLSSKLEQAYHYNRSTCMYFDFPTVSVSLRDVGDQGLNTTC